MPPKKQVLTPAPKVEVPEPDIATQEKTTSKGFRIESNKYNLFPNFLFDPKLWEMGSDTYLTVNRKTGEVTERTRVGRAPSVTTLLVYMWCLDKTTAVYAEENGTTTGIVGYGKPIGFAVIANKDNLGVGWKAVQRGMKHIEKVGLIRLVRTGHRDKYKIFVPNCTRTFDGKQADGTIRMHGKTYTDRGAQQEEEIQFLGESKSASFNLNEVDDDFDLG
jgi:hypothetical protein